jgi:hypothetical protein
MDIYLKTFIINSNNNSMLYVIMNVHNIKEIENKHVNVVYLRFDFSEGGNGCSFRCGIDFFFFDKYEQVFVDHLYAVYNNRAQQISHKI